MKSSVLIFKKNRKTLVLGIALAACLSIIGAYCASQRARAAGPAGRTLIDYYVDFDASMKSAQFENVIRSYWGPQMYDCFRTLYEKTNFTKVTRSNTVKVEKIIHQIWLGSPFPEKYKRFQESWKKYNKDWEYRLWTDSDVKKLKLDNQELYDKARNYGEKSDILRYELLYRYGGVYVDTDQECLKSLDELNYYYDFYIGIQPLDTNIVQLGIGLIGAQKGHPLLKKAIEELKNNTHVEQIIAKTGPVFFTLLFYEHAPKMQGVIGALPSTYFYPCGYTQDLQRPELWQKPESFAVHHWEGSWLKEEGFMKAR
jgi:inositol phosphorylceramide mannosyltransferase catalytic subunit